MNAETQKAAELLRDIEVDWLAKSLGNNIANLGYPVGCGVPPTEKHLQHAAEFLFERFVGLSELLISRDAKRYRKLRQLHWSESSLCVVIDPKRNLKLGSYCPSGEQLDEAIDAIDDSSDDCGDDPDIWKGKSKPCGTYTRMMQRKRLIDAAPELLAALKVLLRDVEMVREGNAIDDGIELEPAIYQARKAIELAEKVRS